MLNSGIIVFFYINNIIFCYHKKDKARTEGVI
jgi:hypothetical protein